MTELWAIAFPILLVDIANPVLLAAVIVCASTARPMANALILILGHTLSYFTFGLLIIYGLADLIADWFAPFLEWFNNPQPGDYLLGLLLGVVLLWIALAWKMNPPDPQQKTPKTEKRGLFGYLFFGAVVNFIGAPFAVPYFAFINQLLRLEPAYHLPNLVLYNALYAAPFLLVPLSVALVGKSILPLLERINQVVDKVSGYIMPVLFAALGLTMVVDAVLYFATGTGLI